MLLILLVLPLQIALAQEQAAGIAAEWDVKANMKTLAAEVRRLEPVLTQIDPRAWVEKGAPAAYVKQAESVRTAIQHLVGATDKLAQEPEKLTAALDALFRVQYMESLLGSLREGVRKYQSPSMADQISGVLVENAAHREKLRQHIVDLANTREHEIEIMNREAQRCRETISRQPPAASRDSGRIRKTESK